MTMLLFCEVKYHHVFRLKETRTLKQIACL